MLTNGGKVTLAGSAINFCLGIFYAWSVFADGLIKEFGWSKAEATFPYTLELLVFSVAMIFGGRFQDRFGPRRGIFLSGIFTGLALIFCSFATSPIGVTLSFGIIFGAAAAFGYAAVTPAVIRWFSPSKRGLVTGIVLMSMGASALVWAPVVNFLILHFGVSNAFLICGILILLVITASSRVIDIPPKEQRENSLLIPAIVSEGVNSWRLTIRRPAFIVLWLLIGLSSGIGFMLIGHLVQIAELNYSIPWGYALVALFALTNALGRLGGGMLCDRIGYIGNLKTALYLMVTSMLLYLSGWSWPALVTATALLGISYGSLYTSFPVIIASHFGLENFGINYGMAFTSIGIVGSLGPLVAAFLAELSNSYNPAFIIGLAAALICFLLVSELKKKTAVS